MPKPKLVETKSGPVGRPKQLKLTLDLVLENRLDELLPVVAQSAVAREFGVKVDRVLVARIALLRGLGVMEAAGAGVMDGGGAADGADKRRGRPSRPSEPSEPLPSAEATAEIGEDGLVVPPKGWRKWSDSEVFPECQTSTHEYYMEHGWSRYFGSSPATSGDEVIAFYWCPDKEHQGLLIYDEGLRVQETPWGPGHIIPHGWVGPAV